MNFVDIGANVGLYSALALSHRNQPNTVLCIEPHNESLHYLKKNIDANHLNSKVDVIISNYAVSASEGSGNLFINNDNKGDNRLYSDKLLDAKPQTVETTTLDKLCLENDIANIQFIKIDVQGFEFNVLKGATKVLHHSDDCILMSEFWPYGLNQSGGSALDYHHLLKTLGFELFVLQANGQLIHFKMDILEQYSGRKYLNIIGLKGKYLSIANT